jgi:hypothetical protein
MPIERIAALAGFDPTYSAAMVALCWWSLVRVALRIEAIRKRRNAVSCIHAAMRSAAGHTCRSPTMVP